MNLATRPSKRTLTGLFWTLCAVTFVLCLVFYPQAVYRASHRGLKAWWEIVFPALLPFFIGTELLAGFGVVRFMGILLEPVMRPLFNLPGAASFVLAVGFTSGFPIGSILTANLRAERLVTRAEGERLMSFTNNASPLFMLAAVAVGMYHDSALGFVLAASHYGANMSLGLLMGFLSRRHGNRRHRSCRQLPQPDKRPQVLVRRAFREMGVTLRDNFQPLGRRLQAAITKSVNTLLLVGGFMIMFSVIIEVLAKLGVLGALAGLLAKLLGLVGFDPSLGSALATGLFEITLGTKMAAETAAPLREKIFVTAFLLAWSGISVHAQVTSFISDTDLRYFLFLGCRLAQALLAGCLSLVLYQPVADLVPAGAVPVWRAVIGPDNQTIWWQSLKFFSWLTAIDLLGLILTAVIFLTIARMPQMPRIRIDRWRWK